MRSAKLMNGRVFAGARALYRAAGVDGKDFGKPIIAIANSFDEFLPGHVHLNKVGRLISDAIKEAGGIPREFNTMAVDDGIAMGHTGMLYSLPSRDIIADTVEYQVNAHCADALICIPNCDKVVPGMLMAALRLNIPTVFVSGGPMEAGTTVLPDGTVKKNTDLIDVMYASADDNLNEEDLLAYEKTVCPTCGSCAGMFTANSMNCLTEAIGLALPGNGTILASHSYRKDLFKRAAEQVVKIAKQYYDDDDDSVLPRSIATKKAFENAMTMDVAVRRRGLHAGRHRTHLPHRAVHLQGLAVRRMGDLRRTPRRRHHRHPRRARPCGQAAPRRALHRLQVPGRQAQRLGHHARHLHRGSQADVSGSPGPHRLPRTVDAHHPVRFARS